MLTWKVTQLAHRDIGPWQGIAFHISISLPSLAENWRGRSEIEVKQVQTVNGRVLLVKRPGQAYFACRMVVNASRFENATGR